MTRTRLTLLRLERCYLRARLAYLTTVRNRLQTAHDRKART